MTQNLYWGYSFGKRFCSHLISILFHTSDMVVHGIGLNMDTTEEIFLNMNTCARYPKSYAHDLHSRCCLVPVNFTHILPGCFIGTGENWGNHVIAPMPMKQPWTIWVDVSCKSLITDNVITTKQSPIKLCAYLTGYTMSTTILHGHNIS